MLFILIMFPPFNFSHIKMEYEDHMVPRLKKLLRERGVKGYSRKKKAELIAMLRASNPQLLHSPKLESQ